MTEYIDKTGATVTVDGAPAAVGDGGAVTVEVAPGSRVVGATVNTGGRLLVQITRVGADTELARMARLVEEAQTGKAQVQRLADRVSAVFVPIVIVLALAAFAGLYVLLTATVGVVLMKESKVLGRRLFRAPTLAEGG